MKERPNTPLIPIVQHLDLKFFQPPPLTFLQLTHLLILNSTIAIDGYSVMVMLHKEVRGRCEINFYSKITHDVQSPGNSIEGCIFQHYYQNIN